ncbi:MAG: DsbA family protein, partial [Candidatus Paceibacterota bacterium]
VNEDIGIMPITAEDHILGDPNARIIIVEYSDTQCPFCKRFHGDMHTLLDNYSDVAWVYRHYPIPSLHTKAYRESIATECAAVQGGNDTFWKYTDEVYARTNSNDSLPDQELYRIAEDLDLNMLAFRTCLENEETASMVDAHMADGSKNGVRGTPTSFVIKDGKMVQKIPGALPYAQLAPFIEELLK